MMHDHLNVKFNITCMLQETLTILISRDQTEMCAPTIKISLSTVMYNILILLQCSLTDIQYTIIYNSMQ